MFYIKANRTSVHIAGITERTKGSAFDYSLSACAALSRSVRFQTLQTGEDLGATLTAARLQAAISGRKMCKNCEKAATQELGS